MTKAISFTFISLFLAALIAGVAVLVTGRCLGDQTTTMVGLVMSVGGACGAFGAAFGILLTHE